jgi:uncharacterized membrane protein YkoI
MSVSTTVSLLLAIALSTPQPGAKAALKVKEDKPGQLAKAKITAEAALATAKAKIAGGTLKNAEIEEEDGKLVYVFNFTRAGKSGEEEVLVNAVTGVLVKAEHESAEDEAKEAAEEKKGAMTKPKAGATAKPAAAPAKPVKPPVG